MSVVNGVLPSLDEVKVMVQSMTSAGKHLSDGAERAALLSSLHRLAASLQTPEDVINRTIFFVSLHATINRSVYLNYCR